MTEDGGHGRTVPPPPTRCEDVVDILRGRPVADPYRWLESPADDPELAAWVQAQASAADAYLGSLPARRWFRDRLGTLWNHPRRQAPWRRGARWFQIANDGSQDQDVLWTAPADPKARRSEVPRADVWTPLIDPATWSPDNTAALTGLAVTDDGRRAAFARSDAGSDWMLWRVMDTQTGVILDDEVPWSKFSTAAWLPDGSAFLYSAYDPPVAATAHTATNRNQHLRLHVVGTDHRDDLLVHARPDQPEWGFWPTISHDGRWLIVTVTHGTHPTNRIHVAPLADGRIGDIRPLLDAGDARYTPLGVLEDALILVTDHDADLGRIVAVDLHSGSRRQLVPEGTDRLQDAQLVGGWDADVPGWIVVRSLHHASSRLTVHEATDGRSLAEVSLPGPGTVTAMSGGREDDALHLTFETFTDPTAVLRLDLDPAEPMAPGSPGSPGSGEELTATVVTPASAPAADHLVVEQVAIHHDGVAVPLFLIHRHDVTPDGSVPSVLWGYGGFDIPITPMYRPGWRAWVDAGGLLAVAGLRGGGEYGRAWHDAGRLGHKEQVFDDALACAAWLTGRRRGEVSARHLLSSDASTAVPPTTEAVWSAPQHLGIEGRSNGGLLVGACLTREPEAFGSAVPEVGVLDMARFHLFTIGWAWTSDYGSPDDADELDVLLRYSPYHRIEPGHDYPATLITTGDTDDRVVPAHSYKFAAALQAAQGGNAPIVLRIDVAAGHGAGKPVGKLLDERADVLAFHAHHLGLAVDTGSGDGRARWCPDGMADELQ